MGLCVALCEGVREGMCVCGVWGVGVGGGMGEVKPQIATPLFAATAAVLYSPRHTITFTQRHKRILQAGRWKIICFKVIKQTFTISKRCHNFWSWSRFFFLDIKSHRTTTDFKDMSHVRLHFYICHWLHIGFIYSLVWPWSVALWCPWGSRESGRVT